MLPYHFQVGDVPFQRALCHIQREILWHDLDVYFHRCWSELFVSQYKLAFFECFQFDSISFVFFLCRLTPIWLEHTSVSSRIGHSFPFLTFLTFSLVSVYIHVCVNVFTRTQLNPLFYSPTSVTEANCTCHCKTSATGHRARKRFQRNRMDDSACCLLPILKADGMWCPTVSRRFHSNKAWAVSLHCDDYKWHLKRPSAAFGSCGMLMDRKAMVKLRTRGEKPVRVALFSIFISGFLVNVVHWFMVLSGQ